MGRIKVGVVGRQARRKTFGTFPRLTRRQMKQRRIETICVNGPVTSDTNQDTLGSGALQAESTGWDGRSADAFADGGLGLIERLDGVGNIKLVERICGGGCSGGSDGACGMAGALLKLRSRT